MYPDLDPHTYYETVPAAMARLGMIALLFAGLFGLLVAAVVRRAVRDFRDAD